MKKYDRWYRLGDTGLKINFYRMFVTGIVAFLSGLFLSGLIVTLSGCANHVQPVKEHGSYPTTLEVVNMNDRLYLFDLSSDNVFEYDGELKAGDYVSAIMDDNATELKDDDYIVSSKYAGFRYIGE